MKTEPQFHLECDDSSVQLWSNTRLPFEPKGKMREARDLLRQALQRMVPGAGQFLAANFRSLNHGFCDVENVLFYNVGAAPFAAVAAGGLQFERIHAAPPVCLDGRLFQYQHEYRLVECLRPAALHPDCSLDFAIPLLSSSTKPHEIWWQAGKASTTKARPINGEFEMQVVLQSPRPFLNLTSVLKPLLDGVICGLHSDPEPDLEAVQRLAARTGWKYEDILHRLRFPEAPVLGPRRLLSAYRDFVKWNPADDFCVACSVLYEPSESRRCLVDLWQRTGAK